MKRTPVISSNIASIGYDPKQRVLELEFMNHRVYAYQDVELHVHEALLRAPSAGKYFFQYIKDNYEAVEVTETSKGSVS